MHRTLRKILILFGALSLLALPLSAAAEEGEEAGDAEDLVHVYDSVTQILIYGLPDECTLPDGDGGEEGAEALAGDETATTTATTVVGDPDVPAGCTGVDGTGPNGQVNHGSIVSAFVHSLRDGWEGGGFGKYVRQVAGSDYGKGVEQVKGSDDDDGDLLGTESSGGPKPKKGKGHNK